MPVELQYSRSLKFGSESCFQVHVLPKAVSYWENALRVRHSSRSIKLLRQCKTEYISFKSGDPHHYCVNGCSNVTMCGEVVVPDKHLMVSEIEGRVKNQKFLIQTIYTVNSV